MCPRSGLNPRPSDPKVQSWLVLRLRPLGHCSFVSLHYFTFNKIKTANRSNDCSFFVNLSEKISQRKEREKRFFL